MMSSTRARAGRRAERSEVGANLHNEIARIGREAGAKSVAAAFYDYDTETLWSFRGDRWFHAASTIKVAVLLGVFDAVERGRFSLDARVHVRNRFLSVVDGEPYRIATADDANSAVHDAIGKTMRVKELALHMIATSSNLATNLLLDLVGIDVARKAVADLAVSGVDLRRGVEDQKAYEADVNNRVTANGLLSLFRAIEEGRAVSPDASRRMLDVLHQQEFKRGIPAGIPSVSRPSARVAHKTGEIGTIAHDAGVVYLPKRRPYAVVVLTEWAPEAGGRQECVAAISRAVYEHVTSEGREGAR
jgi:beta-lactamase class A